MALSGNNDPIDAMADYLMAGKKKCTYISYFFPFVIVINNVVKCKVASRPQATMTLL